MMLVRSSIFFLFEAFAISRNTMNHKILKITFYRFLPQMFRKFDFLTLSLSPSSHCTCALVQWPGACFCLMLAQPILFLEKHFFKHCGDKFDPLCRQKKLFVFGKMAPTLNKLIHQILRRK